MIERLLLTVFGLGRLRPAPGTWGSLPPVVLAWGLATFVGIDHAWMITLSLVLMAVLFSIVCVRFGRFAEREFGQKDPREVVADETAGQSIALLLLPWHGEHAMAWNALVAGVAFASFRLFDIVKPPPVHQVQRLPAGWGILFDDLLAGVYALVVAQVVTRLIIPGWF